MARWDSVQVCVDLEQFGEPVPMGSLHRQGTRGGQEVFSFEYERSWLEHSQVFAFDPDLALAAGAQYPAHGRSTFGIFLDSSPDRWGRVLMQRRENARARHAGRKPRALTEWDFLLGVHDETRLGAMRFRSGAGQPFIDSDEHMPAPPITSLGKLQAASLRFEQHKDDESHPDYESWLEQLFAPGTSLGGARPKASVRDEAGALCMAKFPSRNDTRDVGAWELLAHRLAADAGIVVPEARALRLADSPYTTFLVKRFDRTPRGRLAFVSAMTLTQRSDGETGASYLELVDLLQSRGVSTRADCEQLFRRVVFSILIHNTDDHLRNHGFFIDGQGIRLSPAFDINPSIERRDLSLAIDEVETTCDVAIAMDACQDYGLTPHQAHQVVQQVTAVVAQWRSQADSLGIPRSEQELMAPAFEALNSA
jgi:serine/threonine-protein kinase HipA